MSTDVRKVSLCQVCIMLSDQSSQMTNDYAYKHTYKIHAVAMVAIGIHLLKLPAYGHVL